MKAVLVKDGKAKPASKCKCEGSMQHVRRTGIISVGCTNPYCPRFDAQPKMVSLENSNAAP